MAVLFFALFGLAVGFLARALLPSSRRLSLASTTAFGLIGSLVGALLASLVTSDRVLDMTRAGVIGSVVGVLVLHAFMGRTTSRALV